MVENALRYNYPHVAALAEKWGVTEHVIGKTMWCEIALEAATPVDAAGEDT